MVLNPEVLRNWGVSRYVRKGELEGVAALLTRRGGAALGALCIHLSLESDGAVTVSLNDE